MFPAPLRRALLFLPILLLLGALAGQIAANRTHRRSIELLRAENSLLARELRLLEQQLEAERILAAARLRHSVESPAPAAEQAPGATGGSPAAKP